MTIYIDADGCPVIDLTIAAAKRHKLECVIVTDTSHYFNKDGARTVTVSQGTDSVDLALVNMLSAGDIAITQDYALAALCLSRRAYPIDQNGRVYDDSNIDALLLSRHTAQKLRRGGAHLKGAHKRTQQQNKDFAAALENLISEKKAL